MLGQFRGEINTKQDSFYCYENVLLSFQYFLKYRDYILNLCRSGFLSALLEELNRFHESVEGTMSSSSIQRYQLYTYIGALLNTGLVWLSGLNVEERVRYRELTCRIRDNVREILS